MSRNEMIDTIATFASLIDICASGGHTNFKSDSLFSFWPSMSCALRVHQWNNLSEVEQSLVFID
jgi:hypothetical protein